MVSTPPRGNDQTIVEVRDQAMDIATLHPSGAFWHISHRIHPGTPAVLSQHPSQTPVARAFSPLPCEARVPWVFLPAHQEPLGPSSTPVSTCVYLSCDGPSWLTLPLVSHSPRVGWGCLTVCGPLMMVPSWLTRLCTPPLQVPQPTLANPQAVAGQVGVSLVCLPGVCALAPATSTLEQTIADLG